MVNRYLKYFLLFIIGGCASNTNLPKQAPEYSNSPFLLDEEVGAIIQDYDANLSINAEDNAIYSVRKAVTVLKPSGSPHGYLTLRYDTFRNIQKIQGAIYNSAGKLVRRLNENDGRDIGLTSGVSIYQDSRIKAFKPSYSGYPYTVVYDFTVEYSGLLNLPVFSPGAPGEYVEKSQLKVQIPEDMEFHYRAFNTTEKPQKTEVEGNTVYTWRFTDIKTEHPEILAPSPREYLPYVMLTPDRFKMANSTGRLDSWKSFGNWYYELSEGRDQLSTKEKQKATEIFENAANRREGIKALFEYMQQKTRYVSIQLGIGGWQPFKARFVENKGYGDCKALTNYMHALLKHVGVESHPVLIRNGLHAPHIIQDFPSNQFNHVILYVPGENPIWLESTSQSVPFNYVGISNANRMGLLIKEEGSHLIKTPTYDYTDNRLNNNVSVKINGQGSAEIQLESEYSGAFLDNILSAVAQKSERQRQKWLQETIALSGFSIQSVDFSEIESKQRTPAISTRISQKSYADRNGSRLFIPLNTLNKWEQKFPQIKVRKQNVDLLFSFQQTDTTTLELPKNSEIETLPGNVNFNTSFGTYRLIIERIDEDTLQIRRKLEITKSNLQAEEYDNLRQFFGKVKESDSKDIVLRI